MILPVVGAPSRWRFAVTAQTESDAARRGNQLRPSVEVHAGNDAKHHGSVRWDPPAHSPKATLAVGGILFSAVQRLCPPGSVPRKISNLRHTATITRLKCAWLLTCSFMVHLGCRWLHGR